MMRKNTRSKIDSSVPIKRLRGDAQARRRQLIDAAVDLIARRGYRGTSLKEIARELGVSEPALYYYFRSKEEMLFTIYMDTLTTALKDVRGIRQGVGTPEQKLRRAIGRFTQVVTEQKMFVIFFREKDELSHANWTRITRGERRFIAAISAIVDDGIRDGSFKPMPPTVVTFALLGMAAWVPRWFRRSGPLSIDQVIEAFCEMVVTGVRQRHRGKSASA